jgi:cytochrome c biogenesis protein
LTAANPTAASGRNPALELWAPIWRLLTSVRFAVIYIGLLTLFALIGVLVPQVPEPMRGNSAAIQVWLDKQRGMFGPLTDGMFRLGLFEVYRTRWFMVALAFLVVFVTTCTLSRWAPTFRNVFRPPVRVPERFFDRAHNRVALAPVPVDALRAALRRMRFGRVEVEERDGAVYVFADRFAWAQLSTFVSHLALILFLAGGLVTWATGFQVNMFVGEGTMEPVFAVSNPNQIQVRVDDAVGKFGPRGNPIDYRSRLTLFRNGQEVKSGYATVNDPLTYGGYRFHQVGYYPYGAAVRIRDVATGYTVFRETFPMDQVIAAPAVTITDAAGRELLRDTFPPTDFLDVASGTLVQVPGGPLLWVGMTASDDAAKSDTAWELVAYDPQAGADGARVRLEEGATGELEGLRLRFDSVVSVPSALGVNLPDGSVKTLAQLLRGPAGDVLVLLSDGRPAISLAAGQPVTLGAFEYTFEGPREFTGISVKRDSGAWFIWVATSMLMIGLGLTFYVPRRRLWIRLTQQGTWIAALAEKSGGFEKEMRTLAQRLGVKPPPEVREEA